MDSAITARNPRLIGGISESCPIESYWSGGSSSRLDHRATGRERNGATKVVAASPAPQDFSPRCTERTMPGSTLRKRWRRESRRLIWNPVAAIHRNGSLVRSTPRHDRLSVEQERYGCHGPYRIKYPFRVPRDHSGIVDSRR